MLRQISKQNLQSKKQLTAPVLPRKNKKNKLSVVVIVLILTLIAGICLLYKNYKNSPRLMFARSTAEAIRDLNNGEPWQIQSQLKSSTLNKGGSDTVLSIAGYVENQSADLKLNYTIKHTEADYALEAQLIIIKGEDVYLKILNLEKLSAQIDKIYPRTPKISQNFVDLIAKLQDSWLRFKIPVNSKCGDWSNNLNIKNLDTKSLEKNLKSSANIQNFKNVDDSASRQYYFSFHLKPVKSINNLTPELQKIEECFGKIDNVLPNEKFINVDELTGEAWTSKDNKKLTKFRLSNPRVSFEAKRTAGREISAPNNVLQISETEIPQLAKLLNLP